MKCYFTKVSKKSGKKWGSEMTGKEKIELDFGQALRQADDIDAVADRLGNLSAGKFRENLDSLAAGWKGDSASMYITKGSRLQEQMNTTAKELHAVAADIRTLARRLYNAEMKAWNIAAHRSY